VTVVEGLDLALAALVLAVAAWTIAARNAFPAAVGYVAYGLLLSLVWVRLYALDVALTEAAIGSGVTGVLLIAAAVRLRQAEQRASTPPASRATRIAAALLSLMVATGLGSVLLGLSAPEATLVPEVVRRLPETGLGNPITAVLMAYRAFDTMLEKVVLILAVIGVWSLSADRSWGGVAEWWGLATPDGALSFLAQLLPPIGIVVAIHIAWTGADEPGGAFQGGALLAAMAIIILMARLAEAPAIARRWLRILVVAGPVTFLLAGVFGFAVAGGFLAYPAGHAKALILFIEAFMVLSIAITLPLLVTGPPSRPIGGQGAP
jgi:multisubunit Na+/H+ antiporter MnhB subunit